MDPPSTSRSLKRLKNVIHVNSMKCLTIYNVPIFQVHINLLLFESRLQAELLYALRAIMKYMT